MPEYVYVLSNPAMPDIVKVGRTNDVRRRMATSSSRTEVPLPFVLELAIEIDDAAKLERALHSLLDGSRVNPRREFFQVDPEDLREVLTDCGTDVTNSFGGPEAPPVIGLVPDDDVEADDVAPVTQADIEAGRRWQQRMPKLNFNDLGIPIGSDLVFVNSPDVTAKVIEAKLVEFDGKKMSLSRATKLALNTTNEVAPRPYWMFEGRRLQEITDERYG